MGDECLVRAEGTGRYVQICEQRRDVGVVCAEQRGHAGVGRYASRGGTQVWADMRSEERRGWKESRARWAAAREKRKEHDS